MGILFKRGLKEVVSDTVDVLYDETILGDFDKNCFGFISLNNGAGAKTVATNVAIELSNKYRVCLVDLNLYQPGVWVLLNTPVKENNSLVRYFSSNLDIDGTFLNVKGLKNLRLISASPLDSPMVIDNVYKENLDSYINNLKGIYDYVILSMNYNPFAEWFVYPLFHLNEGYFIWDEQVDCVLKTKVVLDFIHKISDRANNVNNVIINKAENVAYDYSRIDQIECNFISELPFEYDIFNFKNKGQIYMKSGSVSKKYQTGINNIVLKIEEGQRSQK